MAWRAHLGDDRVPRGVDLIPGHAVAVQRCGDRRWAQPPALAVLTSSTHSHHCGSKRKHKPIPLRSTSSSSSVHLPYHHSFLPSPQRFLRCHLVALTKCWDRRKPGALPAGAVVVELGAGTGEAPARVPAPAAAAELLVTARPAAAVADEALVVTNPEVSSVRDSDRILGMLGSKTKRAIEGKEPIKEHLLITRYNPTRVQGGQMLSLCLLYTSDAADE